MVQEATGLRAVKHNFRKTQAYALRPLPVRRSLTTAADRGQEVTSLGTSDTRISSQHSMSAIKLLERTVAHAYFRLVEGSIRSTEDVFFAMDGAVDCRRAVGYYLVCAFTDMSEGR